MPSDFQKRISYGGDPELLFKNVCSDFNLGEYVRSEEIKVGYEDYNVIVTTSQGRYLVKLYGSFRTLAECERYVTIIEKALKAGVNHPQLLSSPQGFLHIFHLEEREIRLSVFEYIDAPSFYSSGKEPTLSDILFVTKQASLIHQIDFKPMYVYDEWSCAHFVEEYEKKKSYLSPEDKKMVEPIVEKFKTYDLSQLPHSLVHGDLISTNILKTMNGEIYILDFSVANWYPRVQDLAVLACDFYFDPDNTSLFLEYYQRGLEAYQEEFPLTPAEKKILPTYIQVAHAVHILNPTYERVVNNIHTEENEFWHQLGRKGLQFTRDLWG